ncbi:hypothetical protein H7R39_10655 [Campylobacter sp. Marseille-Q3452]|uniref:Uncharacterized protein n=1 Tax=Campylobacter massiliensis TaxID=2762557 RepID=A0A842JF95_9BACT|nr:hypothetical protein [Campylobacter massiliensis]MBC2883704.1 hypothetical protein [Campylobacter massiliensis]
MSKDRSLQNIDVTKLLIYVLICIIACLAMIFGLLVPSIKEYKQVKYESRMQIAASAQTQRLYDAKSKALDEIKQNDKAQLDALENKFDTDKFTQFTSKYFANVNLSGLKEAAKNGEISVYELTVTGSMKTPAKFYEFMDALQSYENIVKIDFPIKMRKDTEKIDATFGIKIYSLR